MGRAVPSVGLHLQKTDKVRVRRRVLSMFLCPTWKIKYGNPSRFPFVLFCEVAIEEHRQNGPSGPSALLGTAGPLYAWFVAGSQTTLPVESGMINTLKRIVRIIQIK